MGKPRQEAELRLDARPGGEIVGGILEERGQTYGPFIHNAVVAQQLKDIAHRAPQWDCLDPDMKEGIDVICSKIARITTSSHGHIDNWDDIAGYAILVAQRLRGCE